MQINTTRLKSLKLLLPCLIFSAALHIPNISNAQNSVTPGDETWRFRELELLLYNEKAEANLTEAQTSLISQQRQLDAEFNASGLTRLSQYNCPSRLSLQVVEEHVDTNITTARLYQKYGHYFLCIRAYEPAMETLSKAIPLYQTGFGRESLMERTDPQYIEEVRGYYDTSLHATMQLIEAAGAQQSYAQAQSMTDQYWPRRFETGQEVVIMRSDVINAWEDAIRLLNLLSMKTEEDDARRRLRAILTFDN